MCAARSGGGRIESHNEEEKRSPRDNDRPKTGTQKGTDMQRTYFLSMKSERAARIRAQLVYLQAEAWKAYERAQDAERAAWFLDGDLASFEEVADRVLQADEQVALCWKRIEQLSFRLSLHQEPMCAFCESTWGLSPEIDLRFGVDWKQAARAGCFWCCGSCYAHVLNAAYSNLPEMKSTSPEWKTKRHRIPLAHIPDASLSQRVHTLLALWMQGLWSLEQLLAEEPDGVDIQQGLLQTGAFWLEQGRLRAWFGYGIDAEEV